MPDVNLTSDHSPAMNSFKPYRVLLVSGHQMKDDRVIINAGDFGDIAALLIMWGVPFDTIRLDMTPLEENNLLTDSGKPKYGVIIWCAGRGKYPGGKKDFDNLEKALIKSGISLIAIGNHINSPEIQKMLGISYKTNGYIPWSIKLNNKSHFITMESSQKTISAKEAYSRYFGCLTRVVKQDVTVLATSWIWPQLTIRSFEHPSGLTSAIWIGPSSKYLFSHNSVFIELFKRALIWAIGYSIIKEYGRSVILRMDDPGCAETAYCESWKSPQLTQEQIHSALIKPLLEFKSKLNIAYCPGYPWIPTKTIERSSMICFTDPFNQKQNIRSTFAGLKEGMKQGLFEIHSHGLTHQPPDLFTPIVGSTNWWDGNIRGEWAIVNWYREFVDQRRSLEINMENQKIHLDTSKQWIREDFSKDPIVFMPGGFGISGNRYVKNEYSTKVIGAGQAKIYDVFLVTPGKIWLWLGKLATDKDGYADCRLPAPILERNRKARYLVISDPEKGAQFISKPFKAIKKNQPVSIRDFQKMDSTEREICPFADEELAHGHLSYEENGEPSQISENYTYKLAAKAGFGMAFDVFAHYLGEEHIISIRTCDKSDSFERHFSRGVPAVLFFHDRDVFYYPDWLSNKLDEITKKWPDVRYLSMNEWTGYMHTMVTTEMTEDRSFQIKFSYKESLCHYQIDHLSNWSLYLSDHWLEKLNLMKGFLVSVDGIFDSDHQSIVNRRKFELIIPEGAGEHNVTIRSNNLESK